MTKTRKITILAIIISQALVLHYIESFIPVLAPGAKLGLANIMTMVTLVLFGFKEALIVVVIRSVLGPLLGGSVTGILYSLSGGILSGFIMSVLYLKLDIYFSLMGISTAGAVFHNIGQLLTASWIFGTIGILYTYLPVLMLAAVVTGYFNGLVTRYILGYLEKKLEIRN
ncbi:MAG: Gx transporter family protein [Clostridiales bacterium]|nr:Gx transporter family protein [Clostridiales bacterium]